MSRYTDSSEKSEHLFTVLSVLFHVGIVLVFTIKTKFFPSEPLVYQSAIRVDMVALPDKIKKGAMIKPKAKPKTEKPKPKAVAKKPKPKSKPKKKAVNLNKKNRKDIMNNALAKLDAIEKLKEEVAEEEAQQQPEFKGNIISKGSSLNGINKLQYDDYLENLDGHVKQFWNIPSWMAQGDFRAKAVVKISPDGFIIYKAIIESSGNQLYDEAVLETITKSSPFPAPPEKFKVILENEGLVLGFPE